jgi:hypothetical protein
VQSKAWALTSALLASSNQVIDQEIKHEAIAFLAGGTG